VQNPAAPAPGLQVTAAPAAGKVAAAAQTANGTMQATASGPGNAADDADAATAQDPQPAGSAATPAGIKSPVAKAAGSTAGGDTNAARETNAKETDTKQAVTKDADAKTQAAKTDDTNAADITAAMKTAAVGPAATPELAAGHGAANPADLKTGAVSANPGAAPAPQSHPGGPNMNGLAVEIAARSQSGIKQFDIRLDPPELGHVEVRLSIDATGKAQAHLSADQPQTLDLLQKDAPALTRALRDAGLDVGQGALNFSLRGQNQQAGGDSGGARGGRSGASRAFQTTKSIDVIGRGASAYTSGAGLLDIQV
jgi:flagellar hook-length control protein FliK